MKYFFILFVFLSPCILTAQNGAKATDGTTVRKTEKALSASLDVRKIQEALRSDVSFYLIVEGGSTLLSQKPVRAAYDYSLVHAVGYGQLVFLSNDPFPSNLTFIPWKLLSCISDALLALDSGADGGGEFETVNYVLETCGKR